ncbi:DUF1320 domain-containing protein [Neisseria sp. 19428wB4_WF04]|nr:MULTISPECIES: DUF1320 domain-containing protein [unclassified Neisseria]MBF0802907.1 DUF1320 domain-containing protein [Neisseria sp. 19428wB4_WF04]TFU44523.1 DUF1320 domain-containing protein [Neisseria sp. WF04]
MRYITRDDLAAAVSMAELVQLTNDQMSNYGMEEPDWNIVDRAIVYASELIDGHISGRYALPLEPVPGILPQLATDIARFWLHQRRINTADFPKPVQAAYDNALKMLAFIRDGKIHLGIRDVEEPTGQLQPERGAYRVRAGNKLDTEGY